MVFELFEFIWIFKNFPFFKPFSRSTEGNLLKLKGKILWNDSSIQSIQPHLISWLVSTCQNQLFFVTDNVNTSATRNSTDSSQINGLIQQVVQSVGSDGPNGRQSQWQSVPDSNENNRNAASIFKFDCPRKRNAIVGL